MNRSTKAPFDTKTPFNREKQFAAKRQAVIYAAGQAFRRRGYHNASMTEIAQNLGLTKAALDYLENLFLKFVAMLTQSGVSLLTDVDSLSGTWKTEVLARRRKIENQISRIVKDGQKDGSIRSGDAQLHVFFFMGALNWLNAWYESEGRLKGSDIADHFAVQMRAGIAT